MLLASYSKLQKSRNCFVIKLYGTWKQIVTRMMALKLWVNFMLIFSAGLSCFEQEDPMKPLLDAMMNKVVQSLSGTARAFYDREFSFFNEVTSISGKLKPYIKKTKPEKKVSTFTFRTFIRNAYFFRPKSTKKWQRLMSILVFTYQAIQMESSLISIRNREGPYRVMQRYIDVPLRERGSQNIFRLLLWQPSKSGRNV